MPKGSCENRDVVHVDHRLHSPNYDWEGDEGLAWSEMKDGDAMCYYGICDHDSYNAWLRSTDEYITHTLIPHYNKISSRAKAIYGGAALPIELSDKLLKVKSLIDEFEAENFREKTWKDDFLHPTYFYWRGEIKEVIHYFDEAACLVKMLDDVAATELKSPALAKGVPQRTVVPPPGGGTWLGGTGGEAPGAGRSAIGTAVGIVAIGAGLYFGYKVLTE